MAPVPARAARRPRTTYRLLTLIECRRLYGVDHRTVYAWCCDGAVHPVGVLRKPVTGRLRYPEWEIAALAAEARRRPNDHS